MMARPECDFPTIEDARDVLQNLVEGGFGALPMQSVIVPPSTLTVLASSSGHHSNNPAIMLEMFARDGAELGVLFASVDQPLTGGKH